MGHLLTPPPPRRCCKQTGAVRYTCLPFASPGARVPNGTNRHILPEIQRAQVERKASNATSALNTKHVSLPLSTKRLARKERL